MWKSKEPLPSDANYLFYANKFKCRPDDMFIDELLDKWYYKYDKLESAHGFIQWIFPELNRVGSNPLGKALTKEEAKLIRNDKEIANRVVKAYRMMLNFYGIILVDEQTGELKRNEENYKERYKNFMKNTHNHNRIRRIIRSLGQMGFASYRKPLVAYFAKEIENGELKNCHQSLVQLWEPALQVDSPEYIKDTTETADDRTPSAFFLKPALD